MEICIDVLLLTVAWFYFHIETNLYYFFLLYICFIWLLVKQGSELIPLARNLQWKKNNTIYRFSFQHIVIIDFLGNYYVIHLVFCNS